MQVNRWRMLLLAWVIAGVSTLGALFIGEVMGQMPCVLCWYQRIAMFPLAIVLGVGAYRGDPGTWRYALPLSIIGLLIAGYHSLMYSGAIPAPIQPCTATGPSCSGDGMQVAGIPIPYLSAAAFAGITLLITPFTRRSHEA
jgi:disulfide bond formation protein DsbB